MVVEVFCEAKTQMSMKLEVESMEEAVHKAAKQLNSYNTEVGIITLFNDRGIGHSMKVHDIDLKWESVLTEEPA